MVSPACAIVGLKKARKLHKNGFLYNSPLKMYRFLKTRSLVAVFRYEIAAKRIDFWKHGPLLQFFDTKLLLNVSIFGNRTNQAVPSEIPVSYAKKLPSKKPPKIARRPLGSLSHHQKRSASTLKRTPLKFMMSIATKASSGKEYYLYRIVFMACIKDSMIFLPSQ